MEFICVLLCLSSLLVSVTAAPADGFVFPDDRRDRKLEPIITPPVLPVLEHLERDPSTLLPNERKVAPKSAGRSVKPRFGFGGGLNVAPNNNGGLSASISSSASGAGASQSASQSFSFGFNEGFSASQSASQSSSFNGFGSGFSGSQASSQAASFNGGSASGAASSASAFGGNGGFGGGGGGSGSQSASSAFGFNSLNGFSHAPEFGEGIIDVRHRGAPKFPFPEFIGRSRGVGAASFRTNKNRSNNDDLLAVIISN